MSGTQEVLEAIKQLSDKNLDTEVRATSFKEELEEAIRGHIHIELQSWFFFRKLSNDCCRSNVALHGFGTLWKRCMVECLADANWLESYLAQRGGRSRPTAIEAPSVSWPDDPVDPVRPVYEALQVEKRLLEDLQRLCEKANQCGDGAAEDAIQTHFLRKETRHVKDMGDLLQQCVRVSKQAGHGLYHLDKELRQNNGVVPWGMRNDPDTITEELYSVKV
ncbi:ferritin-like superfamily [Achaetomium macrosporum]|uniref:Ferritin n=1 Tax=Achaetomium macrosporum TaxID=79813 RepID=A0AAN7C6A5_9PEZI|nr:ferritin-like superfamily [Achaetomium macrosporum]